MPKYVLLIAPSAKTDLKELYQYGLRKWGKKQSDRYLESLKEHFWLLTEQPFIGVKRPDLRADLRSLSIENHTLFYRVASDTLEIIRVLHGRQDPLRHLK